ncbi:complement regulator-acquiring protein, partial [Borreliella garinii]|uniref:complement regulator-acquiring protein n=1 Tax=Borreliella garinii TaxID=29519 RepID=UPI001AF016FD
KKKNIISDYDKYAGIRADGIVLKEFIKNGYEHKFNPNKSMQILMDIETLLKACCDHIHY